MLNGIRVVSIAPNLPGPAAAARLRAMGADVLKVEPPTGDPLAGISRPWYEELCAGQERITLDLKNGADRAILDARLADADLLLTSSRPAALERLGLHWPALHARFPRLCQVGVVGYPPPLENRAGHDLTYQAHAGLLAPPHMPRSLFGDMAAAERAVAAACAALLARERGFGATCTWVAIAEVVAGFAASLRHGLTGEGGALGGSRPAYRLYRAAEGWIAVAALEPRFERALRDAIGHPDGWEAAFLLRAAEAWEEWADERDLPIARVREAPTG